MIANQVATSTTAASSSSSPAANLNEMMEALALTITNTSASDIRACSHGSTSTHFPDGRAYRDVLKEYYIYYSLEPNGEAALKFAKGHPEYFRDLDFAQYLFALCTSWYLKLNGTTLEMKVILQRAISIKYVECAPEPNVKKVNRYFRAILAKDDRGVINCLSRETKSFCNCMGEKKTEADGMEKTDRCCGCLQSFPRSDLKKCSGCQFAMFCNTEGCYDEHWLEHREDCKEIQQTLLRVREQQAVLRELEEKQQQSLRWYEEHWPKHREVCKEIQRSVQKQQARLDDQEEKQQALLREPKDSQK